MQNQVDEVKGNIKILNRDLPIDSKFENIEEWKNFRNILIKAHAQPLPSTSAANTHHTFDKKCEEWFKVLSKSLKK